MNKFLFLATVLLSILFISCKDDDNDNKNSIEGEWQLISTLINGKEVADNCNKMDYIIFGSSTFKITNHVTDSNTQECNSFSNEFSYRIEGEEFTTITEEQDFRFKLMFFDNKVSFTNILESDENDNIDSVVTTYLRK